MRSTLGPLAVVTVLLAAGVGARQAPAPALELGAPALETYIELLRQQAGIPAISGAIVQDGVIVWERGLGFADLESRVHATPDTPYLVGDLTQTLAAVLLLQCVERRHLQLDAPVRAYSAAMPDGAVTLRQVMTHAAADAPGGFRYDPQRYAVLSGVVEACAQQPYRTSVAHHLFDRLAMIDSVPGRDLRASDSVPEGMFEPAALERYGKVLDGLAVPYRVDRRGGRASRTELPADGINAATGIVSTVRDLARFDRAIDEHLLLTEDTLAAAWTPAARPGTAAPLPTGLGWFVQHYRGTRVVWHFGLVPNAYSALVVKVPARRITMILLANGDGLAPASLPEGGDVTRSLFATVFLRMLL